MLYNNILKIELIKGIISIPLSNNFNIPFIVNMPSISASIIQT